MRKKHVQEITLEKGQKTNTHQKKWRIEKIWDILS